MARTALHSTNTNSFRFSITRQLFSIPNSSVYATSESGSSPVGSRPSATPYAPGVCQFPRRPVPLTASRRRRVVFYSTVSGSPCASSYLRRYWTKRLIDEGRTVQWDDVVQRLESGTIAITWVYNRHSDCFYPGCCLWWYPPELTSIVQSPHDAFCSPEKLLIVGAPRWAHREKSLRKMLPNATVIVEDHRHYMD
jgi:hypothetical protein